MNLCHLCFAVACDSGFTYFLRNITSTSSRVRRLFDFTFLNACNVSFLSSEWKIFIFMRLVIAGCILIIVWNKSSKSFSVFPSNVIEVVLTGRIVIECGSFCRLTSTSANLLIWSWAVSGTSGSGADKSCPDICFESITVFQGSELSEFVLSRIQEFAVGCR